MEQFAVGTVDYPIFMKRSEGLAAQTLRHVWQFFPPLLLRTRYRQLRHGSAKAHQSHGISLTGIPFRDLQHVQPCSIRWASAVDGNRDDATFRQILKSPGRVSGCPEVELRYGGEGGIYAPVVRRC